MLGPFLVRGLQARGPRQSWQSWQLLRLARSEDSSAEGLSRGQASGWQGGSWDCTEVDLDSVIRKT